MYIMKYADTFSIVILKKWTLLEWNKYYHGYETLSQRRLLLHTSNTLLVDPSNYIYSLFPKMIMLNIFPPCTTFLNDFICLNMNSSTAVVYKSPCVYALFSLCFWLGICGVWECFTAVFLGAGVWWRGERSVGRRLCRLGQSEWRHRDYWSPSIIHCLACSGE